VTHAQPPLRPALSALAALALLAALPACSRAPAEDPSGAPVTALFDVQPEASAAFRTSLGQRFGAAASPETVEAGLVADGFECGPDPTESTERACVREVADGGCTLISIVRSAPFLPDGAQVVRACPQGAAGAGASAGGR
jgi:hypothetical protein